MNLRISWQLVSTTTVLCLLYFCSLWTESHSAAVISIDFSSEWIKIALVKPGIPMEIVLNKESKRKTPAVVSLRNGERLFGEAALSTAVKYPRNAYWHLQLLVGLDYDNPIVQQYKKWFPYHDIIKDKERGTILFRHDDETVFTPEELVGMLFDYCREISEDYAGQPVRDVVVTVPAFYSQAQRRAMLQAAKFVGLNVLQLMTDSAGAALNYGLFHQSSFNSSKTHSIMIYDMGSTSTIVSIIEYRNVALKEGTVVNTYPQLAVKGVGFDRTLGGLEMDIRLKNHLAALFNKKGLTSSSVYDSPRAMSKLLKEAKRLKKVLSANTGHVAQVESLIDDVDFKAPVTREEFEGMCGDLFDRIAAPVQQALKSADMTLDEMDSVILFGGSTRVPKVQEKILEAIKGKELSKNLNTDEAAALGAVYQSASLSKQFKVSKFLVKDSTVYPIQVSFVKSTVDSEGVTSSRSVTRTLFQTGNSYPQKKLLTFNRHTDDFSFSIHYGTNTVITEDQIRYLGPMNLTTVQLTGVAAALTAHSDGETGGVKVHFRMDESGLFHMEAAESIFEYQEEEKKDDESTLSKITSTLSNLFGGSSDEKKEDTKESEDQDTQTVAGDDGDASKEKESEKEEKKPATDETVKQDSESKETKTEKQKQDKKEKEKAKEKKQEKTDEEATKDDNGDKSAKSEKDKEKKSDEESTQETPSPSVENATNETTEGSSKNATGRSRSKSKKRDGDEGVKMRTVKVNLTAEVTQLDHNDLTTDLIQKSEAKLRALQQRDEEKKENEKSKNSLEAFIFETRDALFLEGVIAVSTEAERQTASDALKEAADWLEEDGYTAETATYKQRLRELKRTVRPIFRRLMEAERRPKLISELKDSLNLSHDFIVKIRNLTDELQIFTEVEMGKLENITEDTEQWLEKMEREQNATLAHEDPALTSEELDDKRRKLDRELLYLLNKLRSHPPPKLKKPMSKSTTNNTTSNSTTTTTGGGGGGNTENGATRNGASKLKPENEDKTGNEDEAVAAKDKVKPGEQDPTSRSTESATDSLDALPAPAGEEAKSTDKDTKDRLEL